MKLKDLIKSLTGATLVGDGNIDIKGMEYDSRRIKPGMLFAAITGYKMDGKKFIDGAIKNGAVAVMTDTDLDIDVPRIIVGSVRKSLADMAANFYAYPGRQLYSIGVTGTNGKSTTVFLIRKILEQSGIISGMINSLVYDTGKGRRKAERTTPDSVDMQKYLSEMVGAGCTHAVIEVSSHALVLNRVENINFQIGVFTNFTRDHLDFHRTMDEYLKAKKLFLEELVGDEKHVIINKDVPEFAAFITDAKSKVITYSSNGIEADVMIHGARLTSQITTFRLVTPSGTTEVVYHLPGRYNLANAAAAAAAGVALGVGIDEIGKALESAEPVAGRFQPVDLGQPFAVIIDYAHTSDALERLCLSAREITEGRVLILFGCGGDRDSGKRPLMAGAASRNSDFAILTSDNPRTEDPSKIFEETLPGMVGENYQLIEDRREAIAAIIQMAKRNDTVLIAGKGAEDYQEIGNRRYPFDDKEEVIRALGALGYKQVKAG